MITGAGVSTIVATAGVESMLGAIGTITGNVVNGNACGSPDLGCGPYHSPGRKKRPRPLATLQIPREMELITIEVEVLSTSYA